MSLEACQQRRGLVGWREAYRKWRAPSPELSRRLHASLKRLPPNPGKPHLGRPLGHHLRRERPSPTQVGPELHPSCSTPLTSPLCCLDQAWTGDKAHLAQLAIGHCHSAPDRLSVPV